MEINKQKKRIRYIFIGIELIFMCALYLIYQYFYELYGKTLNIINNSYYSGISLLENEYRFNFTEAAVTLIFIIGVFTAVLLAAYFYVMRVIRKQNHHVMHIIDEINNDEFVPSVLEDEYGLLEEKVYNIKKNNDHYIEILEKEKNEISNYIENIAHQLKTPLTAIRLNEEILLMKTSEDLLLKNQQSFSRIDHLLDSLLKLTRLEYNAIHFDLQQKDIRSLFEGVVQDIQPLINDIKLHVEISDCIFYYDEQWRKEALYNIIKNCIEEQVTAITLSNHVFRNTIQIIIKDNGKGIQEADIPHIFDRFYRGSSKKKSGCGIGLALTKEIISKHHGHIHVYNDHGAVFEINIPLLDIKEKVD